MESYSVFARYYDELTKNVEYSKRADYFIDLLHKLGHLPGLTLDLACGTGSLTLELYRRGLDIYGIDASVEMLSEARTKCMDAGADILFLCQKMQKLDLYGTVNTVICSLDSINHLHTPEEVQLTFDKVSFFMDPGGYFIFDLNTLYKHEKILDSHTFVYDTEKVYCVWQNRRRPGSGRVDIELDFFEKDGKIYRRSSEHFSECAYPLEQVKGMLKRSGFADVQIFDEFTFDPPRQTSQRVVFAAKKAGKNSNKR